MWWSREVWTLHATIPSQLKSNGVLRSDGKWPDGLSLVPWKWGQSLVWDVTCTYTYAQSHLALVGIEAKAEYISRIGFCVPFCVSAL